VTPLHLGNWETVLIAGIVSGHHGSGIYLVPENRFEHRLANASRARYGARFYAAGPRSLRDALRELRSRRGPFIIYVDEFIRGRVQAPSFGRPLGVDANLAYAVQLAKKTNAALISAYCLRLNDSARFRIHVLPPVELGQSRRSASGAPRKHADPGFDHRADHPAASRPVVLRAGFRVRLTP